MAARGGIRKWPMDSGLVHPFMGNAPRFSATRCVQLPTLQANADANTFICNIAGGASSNETGAGGGLTGSDLVLTQNGSIPAVSSGFRTLTASQYFTCTAPFAAAFFNNPEWTYALQIKNLTNSMNFYAAYLAQSAGNKNKLGFYSTTADGVMSVFAGPGGGCVLSANTGMTTSAGTWIVAWFKNGVLHFGWSTQSAMPTGWDSFPTGQRACCGGFTNMSGTWTSLAVVNYPGSAGFAMSIGTIIASKIGLPGAPV